MIKPILHVETMRGASPPPKFLKWMDEPNPKPFNHTLNLFVKGNLDIFEEKENYTSVTRTIFYSFFCQTLTIGYHLKENECLSITNGSIKMYFEVLYMSVCRDQVYFLLLLLLLLYFPGCQKELPRWVCECRSRKRRMFERCCSCDEGENNLITYI